MEEILASIRRIISEEDRPSDDGGQVLDLQPPTPTPTPPAVEAKVPPRPEPAAEPVIARAPAPRIFDEPSPLPASSLDNEFMVVEYEAEFEPMPEPELMPEPEPAPPPKPAAPFRPPQATAPQAEWRPISQETLTSEPVAHQAAGSLSKLMGSMLVSSGATLDDVVRELMKPMLKEWLDANLSAIVEAEVAKEIDRIRRMAR
jgi:cell pole-organizing protein PopZ